MRIVILGASPKPERYAHKAMRLLEKFNHETILVNPAYEQIDGKPCLGSLSLVEGNIDTVTVYVDPSRLAAMATDLLRLAPRRVIFNPGSESAPLARQLAANGIRVEMACTLVLLQTGQF